VRWPVVGLVLALLACQPDPGTSLAERVYGATLDAWYARDDLPPLSNRGDHCGQLEAFDMAAPPTAEGFLRACPPDQQGRIGWACLRWQILPGARSRYRPLAVMHPKLPAPRWAAHGVHELLHAFQRCREGVRPVSEDDGHTDLRVWEAGGAESVETRAERALDGG
jgi:hypothetical protein